MVAAIKAVQEGCTVSKAARDHDVPKTTLYDRVSGRVTHGNKPGPRPYLTIEEEQELGTYLKHCSRLATAKQDVTFLPLFKMWQQIKVCYDRVRSHQGGGVDS